MFPHGTLFVGLFFAENSPKILTFCPHRAMSLSWLQSGVSVIYNRSTGSRWERRLSPWNHTPHYPFLATHTADAMPLASLGGALSDVLWNPKYASYCWKVLVALDWLGNICWVCPLSPGTTPDGLIWDAQGPQRSAGDFVNFEVGIHDGAFKGRVGSIIPFVGRGKLCDRQQEYNDVHGWYRARVEHCFAHLWHWRVFRDVWTGGHTVLHETVRVLLHTTQFCLNRKQMYQPYGPWTHFPDGLWTDVACPIPEDERDSAEVEATCQVVLFT